jgi:hypothetical protein
MNYVKSDRMASDNTHKVPAFERGRAFLKFSELLSVPLQRIRVYLRSGWSSKMNPRFSLVWKLRFMGSCTRNIGTAARPPTGYSIW